MYHFLCWDSERSKFYVTEELFYLEIRIALERVMQVFFFFFNALSVIQCTKACICTNSTLLT